MNYTDESLIIFIKKKCKVNAFTKRKSLAKNKTKSN